MTVEDKMLSYSRIKNGLVVVGYKNFTMVVDSNARKMVKTNPHLRIYSIKSRTKKVGCQKIMNSICSHKSDEEATTFVGIVPCENYDFKTAFKNYVKNNI